MKKRSKKPDQVSQTGMALLIAIFVLMLVSVVAISLLVSSGTETALGSNFRSSSSAYYAALAGLEEGRGRLLSKNPDFFNKTSPGFIPPPGTPLPVGQPEYILNPAPGENVVPWDQGTPATYPDTEYRTEFNGVDPPSPSPAVNSVSTVAGIPGPLYKWVRINAVTESSLQIDVDGDGTLDQTTPLYYDPAHVDVSGNAKPSLIRTPTPPSSAAQALEITALAVLPDGSQKLLQYIAAPVPLNLNFVNPPVANQYFSSVLTLNGNNDLFTPPNSAWFYAYGQDQFSVGSCNPGSGLVYGVGYTNNGSGGADSSQSNILTAITGYTSHYSGFGSNPSVGYVGNTTPPNLMKPSGLDALVKSIMQNADVVITPPATPTPPAPSPNWNLGTATLSDSSPIFPSAMSATNPMTIVVNGNLIINAWHNTGYGLLLVTGELDYDPDASWNGIVLVIGQGRFVSTQGGSGEFHGAVYLAKTRDSSNSLLPDFGSPLPDKNLGQPYFSQTGGGNGFYYSNCWIKAAMPSSSYKVLSFREIPQ